MPHFKHQYDCGHIIFGNFFMVLTKNSISYSNEIKKIKQELNSILINEKPVTISCTLLKTQSLIGDMLRKEYGFKKTPWVTNKYKTNKICIYYMHPKEVKKGN